MPMSERIELIAKKVYGANGVNYSEEAQKKLKTIEADPELSKLGTCMVKTHLSLTDNPDKKGVPKDWQLFIRDFLIYKGAGFVCPVAGSIKLMPGTSSDPAYRRVDVDVNTGKVTGLF
jgi:methylenetetrahydrofolate dehydrogenase (NADP+) / methenyltetrahydrofolate cyclohydrolase / formyltetrahydrofolate synthetase